MPLVTPKKVLVELFATSEQEVPILIEEISKSQLLVIDREYKPVPIRRRKSKGNETSNVTYMIRGIMDEGNISALSQFSFVIKVWNDSRIDHFMCKCNSGRKGKLDDIATCIGAKQLWNKGYTGDGIVVGIVDGGVNRDRVPNVINGSLPDWGTNVQWDLHGNMTSIDLLGIAPDVKIYDMRVSGPSSSTVSNALQAYDWALQQFALDGTPHILSNSWGIYEESWDYDYATNPNHPFTLKVEEVLDTGIKVLFGAGNCGKTCPESKCYSDTGPNRDIWGANGHEEVMTIGAVKLNHKRLKYSSQGPAALFNKKPDFCGYSSFRGYFHLDSGTSAACPVVAGAVALLLDYNSSLTQFQIKDLLQQTAKDIQDYSFDHNTGYGVVRVDDAYYKLEPSQRPVKNFRDKLCDHVYFVSRACAQWEEKKEEKCTEKKDKGNNTCNNWQKNCCTWRPCSWACNAFTWICRGWVWIANVVCTAWTILVTSICKIYITIITGFTLINCKCR